MNDDWIRTRILWLGKQPRCRLCNKRVELDHCGGQVVSVLAIYFRRSEFESRWRLQFFMYNFCSKERNKQKEALVGPFFKKASEINFINFWHFFNFLLKSHKRLEGMTKVVRNLSINLWGDVLFFPDQNHLLTFVEFTPPTYSSPTPKHLDWRHGFDLHDSSQSHNKISE